MMRKSRFTVALVIAFVLAVVIAPDSGIASTFKQGTTSYVVRSGDNLSSIASRYGSSVSAIVQANGLANTVIQPGQTLTIPAASGSAGPAPVASRTSSGSTAAGGTHIVRSGESLWSIASRYGVSTSALRSLNGISGDVILPGQTLSIPASSSASTASGAAAPSLVRRSSGASSCGGSYTVKPGDTLSLIAARCGTSVSRLRELNGVSGSSIYRGQTLQISSSSTSPSSSGRSVVPLQPAPASQPAYEVTFPTPVPPFPPLSYPTPGS